MTNPVDRYPTRNNHSEINPEQLWLDIRKGDPDALSTLFCCYYSCLFNYGYKLVARHDLVKDGIQELFLTIWKGREGIARAFLVKSYLLTSLRRILFRNLKKQKNRYHRDRIFVEDYFETPLNVEEVFIRHETQMEYKRQLYEAVDSLSRRQKEAIYLKFYSGLSTHEIAHIMNINRQSVYNHVSEGIRQLQGMVNYRGQIHEKNCF
ncbi:MAG: sigma-70 family RNA polymerase sigma factor [Balneolaceae bacterium]